MKRYLLLCLALSSPALAMTKPPSIQGNTAIDIGDFRALEADERAVLEVNRAEPGKTTAAEVMELIGQIESARNAVEAKNGPDYGVAKQRYQAARKVVCDKLDGC